MKKIIVKSIGLLIFIAIVIVAIFNVYNWIVCGKQYIKINTSSKAYTSSDLYVSIIAQDKGVDLETKTKLKLLNYEGKKVKDVCVKYEENSAILSIPQIEPGNYILEAKVSSKAGKDTVQKEIYISDGNTENVTITLDKGIYKPGDTVNFRALLTSKENDEPACEYVNVSIYDGNNNRVYNENVKSSDYGILSGSFSLASEVNSGVYKLVVKTNSKETTKQFKVNPYITPKYEVKINYDKESYLVGDTAKITLNAKYFFGEAAENADFTVYINNEKYKTLKADSQGIATMDYEIKEAKTYNIKVETVDSSNYFVEETSSFTAGTDIFEVQLLPEYGSLISGKNNTVYVFTNKADGTPLKTYITVSAGNYTKQVATDENGIGSFSIDINQANGNLQLNSSRSTYNQGSSNKNYYNPQEGTYQFSIVAEDMNKNKVNKKISLNVKQQNLLLATNKAKYKQGEDIKINISSTTENAKNIYFLKNDKLLKMVSTESDDLEVNLDDTYGLIDIYVTENAKTSSYYYNSYNTNTYKRTIFIKPTKQLNINISTDKEEYKPGEKISISFDAVDENKAGAQAALLVSMLDNSILSLANNDLSIDNIKMSLQDIKFSNDLDAATLYSCIMDDSSEQTMMALLLKQSGKDISVSETGMYNYEQEEKSAIISIILIVIIVITVITFLCIKFKKFRAAMKHVINFIMYDLILVIITACIIEEFFWRSDFSWWIYGIITVIGLATYIAFVSKLNKKVFRTSVSIIIAYLLGMFMTFLISYLEIPFAIIASILAVAFLILVVLTKISEMKAWKINKYMRVVTKEITYIALLVVALIPSLIIGGVLQGLIRISGIMIPAVLIGVYFFNYKFNRLGKDENQEDIHIQTKSVEFYILIVLALIGVLTIGYAIINILLSNSRSVVDSSPMPSDFSYNSGSSFSGGIGNVSPQTATADSATTSSSKGMSSILSEVEDMFSTSKTTTDSKVQQETNNIDNEETENETDENVRNVFLESMCFVPELLTTNGNANLDLKLSDNITTWTIQTVGNTKDGRIGYGILDNVKVFKDFFVDFELPKNLVETDNVSIPVTVYNYTESPISTVLKIKQDDWFTLSNNNINVNVEAKSSSMVYVPITVKKAGNNTFKVGVVSGELTDIVQKQCQVATKGYKVEKVVSTGILDEDISEDLLILEDIIENTAKAKVKIYSSTMSQTVEGMENIFKMPTGCFEQISSTLYPNILALKYLEDNGIANNEIKEKAISYISSGYQKLLTYEVKGESGGYSLYGKTPAETVLTAYGLMEVTDLSEVYTVDDSVIQKMTDFLYRKQNSNGTFTITGNHTGGASSKETLALNAYITWALSECNPNDQRLNKSVEYLKNKLDAIDDNYTLALVANTLANVKDKELNNVLKRLVNNVSLDGKNAYITSAISDYYGSRANVQTVQTVALTSMALSKGSYAQEKNKQLINYLISQKDTRGTWYSTQATILALKALNERNEKVKLENQTITVKVNSDERKIEIKDNPLELYEVNFDNLNKENKLSIDIQKGNAYYEVIEEYYIPYEKVDMKNDNIEISVESNNNLKVNEILKSNIKVINMSENNISNGMVTISIPQGFTVIEESLMLLENKGIIEKYETSYTEVNIYLRNFSKNQIVDLGVWFRASYPVNVTGLAVRAYDYYNPEIEGKALPIEINVN